LVDLDTTGTLANDAAASLRCSALRERTCGYSPSPVLASLYTFPYTTDLNGAIVARIVAVGD